MEFSDQIGTESSTRSGNEAETTSETSDRRIFRIQRCQAVRFIAGSISSNVRIKTAEIQEGSHCQRPCATFRRRNNMTK